MYVCESLCVASLFMNYIHFCYLVFSSRSEAACFVSVYKLESR